MSGVPVRSAGELAGAVEGQARAFPAGGGGVPSHRPHHARPHGPLYWHAPNSHLPTVEHSQPLYSLCMKPARLVSFMPRCAQTHGKIFGGKSEVCHCRHAGAGEQRHMRRDRPRHRQACIPAHLMVRSRLQPLCPKNPDNPKNPGLPFVVDSVPCLLERMHWLRVAPGWSQAPLHDACLACCMLGHLPPVRLTCIRRPSVPRAARDAGGGEPQVLRGGQPGAAAHYQPGPLTAADPVAVAHHAHRALHVRHPPATSS